MTAEFESAALDWTADGAPRSKTFDDIYFSTADGLAESRAVFLAGCGLPEAWTGRAQFTVGELGFGTGLNIVALLDLWRQTRAPGQRLSIFSIEAFPLAAADAARALGLWPELSDLAGRLTALWPRRGPGFHRLDFADLGVSLDLAVGEAAWALDQWTGQADAWFLDGFSPAKNPQMWRETVMAGIARRSAPGARLASFTVAGSVRRALVAQGFDVEKRPGHGHKRERLEARRGGGPKAAAAPARVAVIGAGIAGAALTRALAAQGVRPLVFSGMGPGDGASGNRAALVLPALDAGGGPRAAFYAQALARAADLYRTLGPQAVIGEGALQLAYGERDAARFAAVISGGLFDPDRIMPLDPKAAGERLGEAQACGGLLFADAMTVRPWAILNAWLGLGDRRNATVAGLDRRGDVWRLLGPDGELLGEAEAVCLAAGMDLGAFAPDLPLLPIRGQASWAPGVSLAGALSWGGYAVPCDGGVLFGATHDRGSAEGEIRPDDDQRNLQSLAKVLPALAARIAVLPLEGRAGVRAATPDFMPLAGPVPGQTALYILGGLGSRGFTTAPLLAEHLAAVICGAPSPLPRDLQPIVAPDRFRPQVSPQDNRNARA